MKKTLCLIVLISLMLTSCGGGEAVTLDDLPAFATPLETALKGLMSGDGDAYLNAFPSKMAEDYKQQEVYLYYYSLEDMTAWLGNNLRIYKESYGSSPFINGSVGEIRTVSVESLGDANLDYHTFVRYVTEENTEEVKSAVFTYTLGGDDGKESKEATLYFVKQNGKWYLHPCFAFYTF
ncbi:MAG: hypothetical protein IJC49_01220 [Clostridia bacterium]|nr:hypothetical protein [Clostridia bacterium]